MTGPRALRPPLALRLGSDTFLALWCLIALFPILWLAIMSVRLPIDAFAANPLEVLLGPATIGQGKGVTLIDIAVIIIVGLAAVIAGKWMLRTLSVRTLGWAALPLWLLSIAAYALVFVAGSLAVVRPIALGLDSLFGASPLIGLTFENYSAVWIDLAFWRNFVNSVKVTAGVTLLSLTVGTLAGYALSRKTTRLAFWILVVALIFRALPNSVLVTGYLPVFINSAELLRPIFGSHAPTLYGQPLAVIAVLVAINQPFTIWMLKSFFANIPADLDEAARVDGCSHFQAFRLVIMPVMWPGVITTGLFSFLLAYNDFLVTSLLLDASNQTMVPAIASFFNRETTTTDQVRAVAAAVSITAPLFVLVMVFQRQIVSGLTQGAVKG